MTNDDIVKEFREKFPSSTATHGVEITIAKPDKLEEWLRTILAAKDAEIERARQEGHRQGSIGAALEAARAKNLPAK